MVYSDADETRKLRTIKIPTNDLVSITAELGGREEPDRIVIQYFVEEDERSD